MISRGLSSEAGGFIATGLPSPAPSMVSQAHSILPQPRATALRPGGSKETTFVNMVDGQLRNISAKFERRYQNDDYAGGSKPVSTGAGYRNAEEIAKDLEQVVDIVWVSGTPSLQIPFFLNIANALLDYMEPFPFAPLATLKLLEKLDVVFSSLIHREDVQTGIPLPGFENGRRVAMTEKVRLRGIVERTRVCMVRLAGQGDDIAESDGFATDDLGTEDTETEDMETDDWSGDNHANMDLDLDVARVYQRTLADLNETMDGTFT